MARAILVEAGTGREYFLKRRVTRIGRSDDNDIVVRSRIVSKSHMEIRRSLTGYTVVDCGSTHGLYVNDSRVKDKVKLKDGDRIRVLIIYAQPIDEDSGQDSGTFVGKPQAIAKPRLNGNEGNVQVACDYTFRVHDPDFIYQFFNR